MKLFKSLFHFLGSVYLAIALIAICALMVVLGTFLESSTDSHLLAAQWTYNHPFFNVLLWLFFINILFAALRRWPFKWKHLPFLITHVGLLMIFGGAILKNKIGLQGDLNVWEGSASRQLLLPHTYALQVEKRNENQSDNYTANIPIRMNQKQAIYKPKEFPNLSFKVAAYCPHVRDKLESWIKGNYATISGHPPLQVNNWQPSDPLKYEQLPLDQTSVRWNVGAMRTEYTSNLIRKAYLNGLSLHITSKINPEKSLDLNPEDILEKPLSFDNGILRISLSLCYSTIKAFENPHLTIRWQSSHSEEEEITTIALQGNRALYNVIQTDSWLGVSRFNIDLKRDQPTFLMIEDQFDDVHLCSFDSHGRVHGLAFCHSGLDSLIVYDEGFGGYAVQTHLPYPPIASSRKDKEKADGKILSLQIHQAANHSINLSPPLAMFKKACEKAQVNFADAFIEFLTIWQQSYQLLFPNIDFNSPLKQVLEQINWQDAEDPEDRQACQWVRMLFERLEYPMLNGKEMIDFLEANKWPLVNDLKQDRLLIKRSDLLTKLSQQIFSISSQMPNPGNDLNFTTIDNAKLLSAYFKAHEIDYRILNHLPDDGEEDYEKLWALHNENGEIFKKTNHLIETPLSIRYLPQDSPKKIEDRHACILVEARDGSRREKLALAYNAMGSGLKWPIFNGQYTVSFQPQLIEIPYHIRLRQAREIHYPYTQQPYSYESDILIAQQEGEPVEKTLSMNHVHETWDGYRFYLAGMHSASSGLKRVQIVVNHDPAKYLLTYPGSLIVCLGIILLFWLRPYRPKNS